MQKVAVIPLSNKLNKPQAKGRQRWWMVNEIRTREGGWSAPSIELNATQEEWLINPGDHGWL